MVNAFAAPGGYIVLFRGLLDLTDSAEELAGVLAHEVQHILQRHVTRLLLEHASTGLLLAALTGDVSGTVVFALEGARLLGTLQHSRQHETEADTAGLRMLVAANIDPAGMVSLFARLRTAGQQVPDVLQYLSTHPDTAQRIATLKALAAQTSHPFVKLLPHYDWQDMRRICTAGQP
jgi:predicted Zn-dependent protease